MSEPGRDQGSVANAAAAPPSWRLQPLADYCPPEAPALAAPGRILGLLGRRSDLPREAAGPTPGVRCAADDVLERAAPRPPATPFHGALDDWLATSGGEPRVQVVVQPPGAEPDLLRGWATERGAAVVEPPSAEVVRAGDVTALPTLPGDDLLVVPQLERWYLRRVGGLSLVRALVARLAVAPGPVVIGCDSWAWSYLTVAADAAHRLPPPVALAPLDGDALATWLGGLLPTNPTRTLQIRRANDEEPLLSSGAPEVGADRSAAARGAFASLAAMSRGNPWVAWGVWRDRMRTREDTAIDAEALEEVVHNDVSAEREFPDLLHAERSSLLMVLHALLVHGGSTVADLQAVLPPLPVAATVQRLVEAGLVTAGGTERLRVRPAGYPAARRALANAGFPLDSI